ncbi:glycine betaine/L-proline ABC transporter ATP-binding protein [Litorivicinus sp.]|nr:glycine betaine/L-proline ABC transporter ATP-binding protein [Litorivicinus sp.]MDC1319734.1 glycine betaine/L-proline ABC transporter ATP-binding protein [Litorivicinus sp.]MDC1466086.1 glycine betaine/L-proline ABC transporter ATP-binding protein [Litorivicinus sp.]
MVLRLWRWRLSLIALVNLMESAYRVIELEVMMSNAKIEIRHLYKIFGPDPVAMMEKVREGVGKDQMIEEFGHVLGLSDINLKIPEKGIQVVMGLSGSGKSTLIRHINRLIEPTTGDVLVEGENVLEMNEQALRNFRRHRASMVFQKFALLPHRTVMENTVYGLEIQGLAEKEARKQAAHWIDRVGLSGYEENYPQQLSGGMQQRVGLARALATDADILLMDEAFSALDPLIRADMQNILLDLQQELHKTIVFITHDLEEALRIGDQIAILRDGEVVQQGTPQQIILKPKDDYIADFTKDINRGRVIQLKTIMSPVNDLLGPELSGEMMVEDAAQVVTESPSSQARVIDDSGRVIGAVNITNLIRAMARPDIETRLEEL